MAEIEVIPLGRDLYRVRVTEADGTSEHQVTATPADVETYGAGAEPENLLVESFRFLLEREPRQSILTRFALPAIARYFPEYPSEIRRRLRT